MKKIFQLFSIVYVLFGLFSIGDAHSREVVYHIDFLEKYDLEELSISDIRWKDSDWQACFKTPDDLYISTYKRQLIGKRHGKIIGMRIYYVIVNEYFLFDKERDLWSWRYIKIYLPEKTFCDWENAIPNYRVSVD
jgi:Tfp pilus assembly protein PilP